MKAGSVIVDLAANGYANGYAAALPADFN